jgi:hypothetical protein
MKKCIKRKIFELFFILIEYKNIYILRERKDNKNKTCLIY